MIAQAPHSERIPYKYHRTLEAIDDVRPSGSSQYQPKTSVV